VQDLNIISQEAQLQRMPDIATLIILWGWIRLDQDCSEAVDGPATTAHIPRIRSNHRAPPSFFCSFSPKSNTLSFYRRTSLVDDDTQAQDVVTAMQGSIWGGGITSFISSTSITHIIVFSFFSCPDLMMEVAEEERANRSF